MGAGCCVLDPERLTVASEQVQAVEPAGWLLLGWSYRARVWVSSHPSAGQGVEHLVTPLDLTGIPPAERAPGGADVRLYRNDGTVVPAQWEPGGEGSGQLIHRWDTRVGGAGWLYLGYAAAPALVGALTMESTPSTHTIRKAGQKMMEVDRTRSRLLAWGSTTGAITGLWDGTQDILQGGVIRYASLVYNPTLMSEGEMATTTTLRAVAGPAAAVLRLAGTDLETRFEHQVGYVVFEDNVVLAQDQITTLNTSTTGMDGARAPVPGLLYLGGVYPQQANGVGDDQGWVELRGAGNDSRILNVWVPDVPSNTRMRFGVTTRRSWLPATSYFSAMAPGFGGWRVVPTEHDNQFAAVPGGLALGTETFPFAITFGTGPSTVRGGPEWLRYTHPATVAVAPWQSRVDWAAPSVTPVQGWECAHPRSVTVDPPDGRQGILFSRDGVAWWGHRPDGWFETTADREAGGVQDASEHLEALPDGDILFVRVVVPLLPTAAGPVRLIDVDCAP